MKKLINLILAATLAVALVAVPNDLNAQSRRSGSSSSSSSSSAGRSSSSSYSSGGGRSSGSSYSGGSHSSGSSRSYSTGSSSSSSGRSYSSGSSSSSSRSYSSGSSSSSSRSYGAGSSASSSRSYSGSGSSAYSSQSRQSSVGSSASSRQQATQSRPSGVSSSRQQATQSRPSGVGSSRQQAAQSRPSGVGSSRQQAAQSRPSGVGSSRQSSSVSRTATGVQTRSVAQPRTSSVSRSSVSTGTGTTVRSVPRQSQRPQQGSIHQSGGHQADVRFGHDPRRMHPHHMDFIPYDRPGRFFGAGPHYFGYRIHHLPPHYRRLHYWGHTYYFYNDIYYRPFGDYYVVCRPPFGVYYHPSLLDVALCAVEFSYYYDLYHDYRTVNSNWQTIAEQNKIIAENNALIASQNEAMQARTALSNASYELATGLGLVQRYADASTQYYYEDGVFFTMDATGQYKVIVPPAGAIVDKLPEDYEEVVIGGNSYYKVDDTIYRMIMVEGAAKFEVLGQQV